MIMRNLFSVIITTIFLLIITCNIVVAQENKLQLLKDKYSKLFDENKFTEALPLAKQYADGTKTEYGEGHAKYAKAINNVGLIYFSLKDFKNAEIAFKLALSIAEQIDPDHQDVAFALDLLAIVYEKKGQNKLSTFFKKRAGAIKHRTKNDVMVGKELPTIKERDLLNSKNDGYGIVSVFYATDRKDTSISIPKKRYGNEQSQLVNGSYLEFGVAKVSIPGGDRHKPGVIEEPSIFKFEWNEDPANHVVLLEIKKHNKDKYFKMLREEISSSDVKEAFIFIHGYNVTFEDAARRTAQMSFDLKFKGTPVFYSWPSKGATWGYTSDEVDIQWTEPHLKQFLNDFLKTSKADHVYIIAHSMGNRALAKVISGVAKETPEAKTKIKEIILAAPDIDASVFIGNIVPEITQNFKNITLYASSNDNALLGSELFHGNRPRAGDAGDGLVVVPGIETIDVSSIDSSLLGHSYIAGAKSILDDLEAIFTTGKRAKNRVNMTPNMKNGHNYWVLKE